MSTAQVLDWKTKDDKVEQWHEPKDAPTNHGKFWTESPSNIELIAKIEQARWILELEHEPKDTPISHSKFWTESPSNIELKAEIEQAKRILGLEDDWDGEGSPGYSEDTFNRAIAFLTRHVEGTLEKVGHSFANPKDWPWA